PTRLVGRAAVALAGGALAATGMFAMAPPEAQAASGWDEVAECESGGDWSINTGNGYYGGLQFSQSSWEAAGGTQYAERADRACTGQRSAAAENLMAEQGPGAWPNCGTALSGGAATSGAPAPSENDDSGNEDSGNQETSGQGSGGEQSENQDSGQQNRDSR